MFGNKFHVSILSKLSEGRLKLLVVSGRFEFLRVLVTRVKFQLCMKEIQEKST